MLFSTPPVTFRRDRFGESWHLIPLGELGSRSRALCGQPRQGTPLSETYLEIQPADPELLCEECTAAYARLSAHDSSVDHARVGDHDAG
jgi:hypothetical protein